MTRVGPQRGGGKKTDTSVNTCIHVERVYWFSTKSFCCTFAISKVFMLSVTQRNASRKR